MKPIGLLGSDMSGVYNTPLSSDEEVAFQQWASANPRLANAYDYDARGFWKSGAGVADNGHGSDMWKKPNHPTFSTGSKYSGLDGFVGGSWNEAGPSATFTPSETNLRNMPLEDLMAYFRKVEPGNVLFAPWPSAKK